MEGAAGAGGGSKKTSLLTLKETTVDRLPDDVSKADFDNWVEELYVHLERVDGWMGIASLLRELRHEKYDLTEDSLDKLMDRVHSNAENGFSRVGFDHEAKDRELYAYLLKKARKLKTVMAGARSGFETFRRFVREEDPVTESAAF
eukprot:2063618-Lingulodinium_polyedra.AAC.1